eukprot:sb/3464064/
MKYTLKDIRMQSSCQRFKVYKDKLPHSEDRVVEMKGSEEEIARNKGGVTTSKNPTLEYRQIRICWVVHVCSTMTSDENITVSFRLLIPSKAAGSIIGKKAETIQEIISSCAYKAYLKVPESPPSPERLVLITCQMSDVSTVIVSICRKLFKCLREDNTIPQDHWDEVLMLVSSNLVGFLVGPKGDTLKDIRMQSSCQRFKVYKDKLPVSLLAQHLYFPRLLLYRKALLLSLKIVSDHPARHECISYMPGTAPDIDLDCGGYARFAITNALLNPIQFTSGGTMDYGSFDHHRSAAGAGGGGYDTNRIRDRSPMRSWTGSKDIYIDDCYTRHIIGAGGNQIDNIRRVSGAEVEVSGNDTVRNKERKITIYGRQEEIQIALTMINNAIAEKIKSDRESLKDYGYGVPYSGIFTKINAVEAFTDTNDMSEAQVEQQIYIPNSETKSVIGPKGSHINEIRQFTACNIKVQADSEVEGDMRMVTLKGTQRQLHKAVYMIRNIARVL